MARGVCAALVMGAAGCSFSGGSPGSDADGEADIDAAATDAISRDVTCPEDAGLLACYPFDLDTADATGANDATVITGVTAFVPGPDGTALGIQSASRITIADSADFATDALSVELWLGPGFGDGFLFDLDKRFSVRIYKPNIVRCVIETDSKQSVEALLDATRWTHIGCVWDPAEGLQIVIDRNAGEMLATTTPLAAPPAAAAHIGSDSPGGGMAFLGAIDNLRVWSRALEPDQLCVECATIGDPNM